MFDDAAALVRNPSENAARWPLVRARIRSLKETCVRMAAIRDRALFHSMSRRIWDLREELDLLEQYLAFTLDSRDPCARFESDFHRSGTFRGGFIARLQSLLVLNADSTVTAAPGTQFTP